MLPPRLSRIDPHARRRRPRHSRREDAGVAQQVHEAGGDHAIDVQNQVRLLRGRDLLHLEGVVEQRRGREVLLDEVLDDLHPLVGVVDLRIGSETTRVVNYEVWCKTGL